MNNHKKLKLISKASPISFIIPAYNCEGTITESIMSIINTNLNKGDEIIIVDDASTDNTASVIRNMKDKYDVIKIFTHTSNKGSAAASRNTGIRNAMFEVMFCLDADNILEPNSIRRLLRYMVEKQADIATTRELWYFKDNIKVVTHKIIYKDQVELQDALAGTYWPGPSGNYMFTKESWESAGGYDESIGGAYDSWAFGIKQLLTGSIMLTVPGTYYLHRYGYDSTFIRDSSKFNPSNIGRKILEPFMDILDEKSIKYIMSDKYKNGWFELLDKNPLLLKSKPRGINGTMVNYSKEEKVSSVKTVYRFIKKLLFDLTDNYSK